ncbi:MAG TPA: diphosphate--fructose-6-phosphate 1-phosphotransferase [Bryobacteraceae bacterium]
MKGRNLMVVQGGGPTQVLNSTLAAVVDEARATRGFERVLGARGGTKGLVEGSVADLSRLPSRELELLRTSPGAALGSSRFKPSTEDMARIVEQLQRMRVGHVLFIGGNGTMRGAELLLEYCRKTGCEVQVLGLPKTVDNDIAGTDRCPGYASAARYVAQSTRDLGMDLRSLPQPMTILETMGRGVGWLAAAAALGKRDEADAPHLLYLPEAPFEMESFISAVEDAIAKHGWAVVVVSEGICYADGRMVYQKLDPRQADPLNRPLTGGVGQYLADEIAAHLGIRCRCEKPGLLGRASALHASCQDRKDAELVGRAGVRGLLENRTSQMVSLLPLHGAGKAGYTFVELHEAAGIERQIPAEWVDKGAIPVKPKFFEYLQPLAGSLIPYHAPISSELDFHGDA